MAPVISIPSSEPVPALSPDLRSTLVADLVSTTAIPKIHATLLSSCQSTGWLDAVRQRALQLLRSGECNSYREVMAVLLEEVRGKRVGATSGDEAVYETRKPRANGIARGKQRTEIDGEDEDEGKANGQYGTYGGKRKGKERAVDVKIPEKVITEGVKAVSQALDKLMELDDERNDE